MLILVFGLLGLQFIWKQEAGRASPVSEISLCSYFHSKSYCAFIWTSGLSRLPRSRLKEERSCLPGWKFLHINTHKRASRDKSLKTLLQAIFNNCQNNKIVPTSGMNYFYI
jgi:hypothetical protein